MGKDTGSSSSWSPPQAPEGNGGEEMMAMMGPLMEAMMGMQGNMMEMASLNNMPEMPEMPTPTADSFSNTDWAAKQRDLNQKVKADYNAASDSKKSRRATVLTSPILDDEDALTTKSLIAG